MSYFPPGSICVSGTMFHDTATDQLAEWPLLERVVSTHVRVGIPTYQIGVVLLVNVFLFDQLLQVLLGPDVQAIWVEGA